MAKFKIEKPHPGGPGSKHGILDPLPIYHYSCDFLFSGGQVSCRYLPSQKSMCDGMCGRSEGSYLPSPADNRRRNKINAAYGSVGEMEVYIKIGKFSLSFLNNFTNLINIEFKVARPLWVSPSGRIAIQNWAYRRLFSVERLASKRLLKQLWDET